MTNLVAKTIAIGSDHAGFEAKEAIKQQLISYNIQVIDCGTNSADSVDYPDFGTAVAQNVANGDAEMGVVVCGSGVGISIAANRVKGIRCALVHNAEIAKLSRQHNDANVLALGARVLDAETIKASVEAFFTTEFEGDRHQRRVEKLG